MCVDIERTTIKLITFINPKAYEGSDGYITDINTQSDGLREYITNLDIDGPITLIGFSMGGLTFRSMIENWDGHNVTKFLSVASPQMGVCDGT